MSITQFSVATPTWNSLDKLVRCVGSVRGQQGVFVEHVIQDGASTDGTPQWLAEQSVRRLPAAMVTMNAVSESDKGMYDAINRAWRRSSGQFMSWLNADEQYLPGTLEKVARHFERNPRVDVIYGNAIVADPQGRPIALRREIPFRKRYVVNSFLNAMSCTTFFRRRLFDRGLLTLDSNYRYAADMDLMLRLHDAGAIIHHLRDYLSIFGVDGKNLSSHPGMQSETLAIRRAFGGYAHPLLRQLVLAGRRVERLWSGGYGLKSVEYCYAIDELPNYHKVLASKLGGRYSLADVEGRADSVVEMTST